jgi:hypothetical protein
VATPQLAIPSGAIDVPEGGIAWHDARIATLTRDGINAPSLLTMRQLAPFPTATVTPPALIDVLCLDYDLWDSYVTYGLESPTNRFRARKIGKDIAQPPRKRGAPRGSRRRPLLDHNRLLGERMLNELRRLLCEVRRPIHVARPHHDTLVRSSLQVHVPEGRRKQCRPSAAKLMA